MSLLLPKMSLSGSKEWKDIIQLQLVSQLPWFGPSTMAEIKTPPNLLLSSSIRVRCHAANDCFRLVVGGYVGKKKCEEHHRITISKVEFNVRVFLPSEHNWTPHKKIFRLLGLMRSGS